MTIPVTPAGWYPDPASPQSTRWWDGTQWTDHRQQPYDAAIAAAALRAPDNTRVYTPWIWIMAFLPILTLPLLFTIDFGGMLSGVNTGDSNAINPGQFQLMTSPGYVATVLVGWLVYGLCVLFAFLDRKTLIERGVPRPFHWAWTFLSSSAYVIGRSVIVRRRTGTGIAPMWAAIGMLALSMIVTLSWYAILISQIIQQMPAYTNY